MKKRFWAFVLALCVCISSIGVTDGITIWAADMPQGSAVAQAGESAPDGISAGLPQAAFKFSQKNSSRPMGRVPKKTIRVADIGNAPVYDAQDISMYGSRMKGASIYENEWDKYKNYYIYNQLTDAQKEYWDALDSVCMKYMTTKADASMVLVGLKQYYTLDFVGSDELTGEQMVDVAWLFRYQNPQYYFINVNMFPRSVNGNITHIALGVYQAFADGDARAAAKAKVKAKADAWEKQVKACATEEEKVQAVHDLIVNNVEYNNGIYNGASFNEEKEFSQSVYSVFCTDLTVCAGYAQTFAMICNACGLDAISVTSTGHEWNKVRVNDSWYNVDCTWDDQSSFIDYSFFARSDRYYDSVDTQSTENHQEEAIWNGFLPECTLDTSDHDGNCLTPGIFPAIKQTAARPAMKLAAKNGKVLVTLTSATKKADIYYTLDGTQPSPASTKSMLYDGAFSVKKGTEVRAVAVRDTYRDSKEYSGKAEADVGYTVTYKGNGQTSGTMAKQESSKNTVTLKANKFKKKGYTFAGWNTKANGTGKAYRNKQKVTNLKSNLTLYAQWKKTKYKITYHLNGGKNSSKNPASYTVSTKTIKLKNPTQKGYTFKGWYTDKKCTKKVTQIKTGSTGNKTLYAKWSKTKYKISYQLNGGKNNKKNPASYTYTTATIKLKNPTKKGYTFKGWYTDKKCTKKITQIKKGSTGKITLYAKWKKK